MRKLVKFEVWGYEACPWSVPFIGRHGGSFQTKKSRPYAGVLNLPDWQAVVRTAAEKAMGEANEEMVTGPTKTHIEFFRKTPPGHRHGEIWTVGVEWNPDAAKGKGAWVKVGNVQPDILNLFKGTEDAIENVTYANDVQTAIISSSRWYGPMSGVRVTVYLIEPGDYPGTGEPIEGDVASVKAKRTRKHK
jgi:Holliday junction resolvase RusA-like endonuclease